MKKIKIYAFLSLDGFLTRIDGDIEWMMDWIMEHTVRGGDNYGFQPND